MSSNRWISPALQGLLDELSTSPSSVLFGRGAALAEADQRRLATPERAPERWSGRETGLLTIEREILRAHREEVGHLVRQVSFALTRRLPGLVERLDPQLDRAAQARALPRETLEQTRRDLALLHHPPGVARLAQAIHLDLQSPHDALALLRQAQRIAPHASTQQHLSFWYAFNGDNSRAVEAALAAIDASINEHDRTLGLIAAAFAWFKQGSYRYASRSYFDAYLHNESAFLLASAWLADLLCESDEAAEKARLLNGTAGIEALATDWARTQAHGWQAVVERTQPKDDHSRSLFNLIRGGEK